jgi:hypothetical protein
VPAFEPFRWDTDRKRGSNVNDILSRSGAARTALAMTLAILLGAAVLATGSADAAPPKKFTMTIDPTSIVEHTPTEVSFTLENKTAQPIELGSANITIPDGVTVDVLAGSQGSINETTNTIELRNLDLAAGATWTDTFLVTTGDCSDDPYVWEVVAKQANDFSGAGNDFAYVGSFPELTVTCEGEEPEPPSTTNGPTPRFTPPGGWDFSEFCPGKKQCGPAEFSHGGTVAKLTASDNAVGLFLAVKDASPAAICGIESVDAVSGDIYFDVLGDPRHKTLQITLEGMRLEFEDDEAADALAAFEVCFGADAPWIQADGEPAVFDGIFWVGTLAECPSNQPGNRPYGQDDGTGKPIACVESRDIVGNDFVIVIKAPPGDPLIRIG